LGAESPASKQEFQIAMTIDDQPIEDPEGDLFEARHMAAAIVAAIGQAPLEGTFRIGLFGAWGTGKTSTMKLVEKELKQRSFATLWFNPWGHSSESEVREALSRLLANANRDSHAGRDIGSLLKRAAVSAERVLTPIVQSLPRLKPFYEALQRLTEKPKRITLRDLQRQTARLNVNRTVIFVDDLDRADPKLVPGLLHQFKTSTALGNIVFLFGFDPHVVGDALGTHHPGWEGGVAFLDKIIDLPFWIPTPSVHVVESALVDLARRELPFINESSLLAVAPTMDKNPRTVKRFLRTVWVMQDQFRRHDPLELDHTLLLHIQWLRYRWPVYTSTVLRNEAARDAMLHARMKVAMRQRRVGSNGMADTDGTDGTGELVEAAATIYKAAFGSDSMSGIPPEFNEFLAKSYDVLETFGLEAYLRIPYCMDFLETPHIFTNREAADVTRAWVRAGRGDKWRSEVEKRRGLASQVDAARELFRASCYGYKAQMELAVSTDDITEHAAILAKAADRHLLATEIAKYYSPRQEEILAGRFALEDLLFFAGLTDGWSHFDNSPQHQLMRKTERQRIQDLAVLYCGRPVAAVEQIKPWDMPTATGRGGPGQPCRRAIGEAATTLACEYLHSLVQSGEVNALLSVRGTAFTYLVGRRDSPFWDAARSKPLLQLWRGDDLAPWAANLAFQLLRRTWTISQHDNVSTSALWVASSELLRAAWEGASRMNLQVRSVSEAIEMAAWVDSLLEDDIRPPTAWVNQRPMTQPTEE
jgi:hypothetical protein